MTKVGEGKTPAEEPSVSQYHRDLDKSSRKFSKALEGYQRASGEERERFKGVMEEQMKAIRSAVSELKRAGVGKQDVKVENDYKAYLQDGSPQNFSALKHDIETLRDYNELP